VRFVVTDFMHGRSAAIYEDLYCNRGVMEQWIGELKNGLKADRMSCNKFSSNQFRLFMHCAAYVLIHSFREYTLSGTEFAQCTISTFRERFILCAVSVMEKKSVIKLQFAYDHPMKEEISLIIGRLQDMKAA